MSEERAVAELPADCEVTWDHIVRGLQQPIRSARGVVVESHLRLPLERTHFAWQADGGWAAFDDDGNGGIDDGHESFLIVEGTAVRRYGSGEIDGVRRIQRALRPDGREQLPRTPAVVSSIVEGTFLDRPCWTLGLAVPSGETARVVIDDTTGILLAVEAESWLFRFEELELDVDLAGELAWNGPSDLSAPLGWGFVVSDGPNALFAARVEQDAGPVGWWSDLVDDVPFEEAVEAVRSHRPRQIETRMGNTVYDFEGSAPGRAPFPIDQLSRGPEPPSL